MAEQSAPRGAAIVTPPCAHTAHTLSEFSVSSRSACAARSLASAVAAPTPPAFSIAPTAAGERDRHYIHADVCRRYWETRTPLPWSDVHLPNNRHLSADWVPIPPIPMSDRARLEEVACRRTSITTGGMSWNPCCGTRGSTTSTIYIGNHSLSIMLQARPTASAPSGLPSHADIGWSAD